METKLSKTTCFCKALLCSKASERDKNNKSPKAVEVMSWKHTIMISPIQKRSEKFPAGDGEGKEEGAISNLNGKNSQYVIVTKKQTVSDTETVSDTSFSAYQNKSESPTFVKKTFLNVSITKLLYSLSEFLCRRCYRVKCLLSYEPVQWLQAVDNALVRWGWQDHSFISLPSLVFLYMMCRSVMSDEIDSECKLRQELLICLYLTYSYMGSEVTYPIRPFLLQDETDKFWDRCLEIIQCTSADMLKLNTDSQYFTQFFEGLVGESQ